MNEVKIRVDFGMIRCYNKVTIFNERKGYQLMANEKRKNFIEPSVMFDELLCCLKNDQMSEELGRMVNLFSTNLAKHRNFIRYGHMKDDIIQTAVLGCVKSWYKFRPMRNNVLERDEDGYVVKSEKVEWDGKIVKYDYNIHNSPFAFFTTCARNEILQYLKTYHYKQKNIMNELLVEMGEEADYGYIEMMKAKEENERDIYGENVDDEKFDDIIAVADEIESVKETYDAEIDKDDDLTDNDEEEIEVEELDEEFKNKSPFQW